MEVRFDGRVVLVTGAGAGIGRCCAIEFARAGAMVAVTDLDGSAARIVAEEISKAGHLSAAATLDVSQEEQVEQVFKQLLSDFDRIDVLINNAGIGARTPTLDLPHPQWQQVMDVGLSGTFLCTRAAVRQMVPQQSGAIVNVSSVMGLSGGGLYPNAAYHAVKGAVVNLTRAWALEWAPHGIRVNAVAPAFTKTGLINPLLADPEMARAILKATPLGRLVEPEEVAAAILFLASDWASMITGHTLAVDGGWLAR